MITGFRHDKERERKRRQLLVLILVLAFMALILRGSLSNTLGGVLVSLGRPLWYLRDSTVNNVRELKTLLVSKTALEHENLRLKSALDTVAIEAYSRDLLRAENDALKSELGRNPSRPFMLARVLATPRESPYDTLVIDVGSVDGVTLGMEVFATGDFRIGEVTRVNGYSAVVTLFSAPDNELEVTIGSSSISAIAHGKGGGNFEIVLPRGVDVSVGDLVDIPALAVAYAGVVEGILRPEGTSLETIFTKLPFNIYQLKWVYVVIDTKDHNTRSQKP